jgi:16S rRNA (guanine(1405)-N(7))-methyltransferase
VTGAYLPERPDYALWLQTIEQANGEDERRTALRKVMTNHASTRERLPFLDSFYSSILGDLPAINTILDLACGFNPLAASWMPLAEGVRYFACDIYEDQIEFLNRIFQLDDQAGEAFVGNLLQAIPSQGADVALLLKTIPCLEQLDKGIGPRLLEEINAPVIVVSFPARSLGGHGKGMVQNYAAHFAQLVEGKAWQISRFERFDFPTEMVFRLVK